MAFDIDAEVRELERTAVGDLRRRYEDVFGEPCRSFNKRHLVRRIAWRVQALREGGLSERALRRAEELANDADLRLRPPDSAAPAGSPSAVTLPLKAAAGAPGTVLKRTYKGRALMVRVLEKGFEFEGEVYRSLTAVARKVTGSHWNGPHFFGITKDGAST